MSELEQYAGCDGLLPTQYILQKKQEEQNWFELGLLIIDWTFWIRIILDDLMGNPE